MRYEWLDKRADELAERYESGELPREIADDLDVSAQTIYRRLREHGVEMRRKGGPTHVRLADRTDELRSAYLDEERSVQAIADRYETSVTAIRFHLERAGVDLGEPNPKTTDVAFSPFQLSVVHGELLGDGCLHCRDDRGCFFQLSTTTESHTHRLMEKLPDGLFPESQPNAFTRPNQFTGDDYTCWTVSSRPQSLFQRMYDDWYEIREENNRKIVPEEFTLDRTALLHWYWGDGSCTIRESGAPRVSLATHGFPEPSVDHLQSEVDKLGYDNYTIERKGVEDGSGLFIRLRDYDARTFLDDLRRWNTLPAYDRKFPVPLGSEW
jgi:predicted DNA-binding protein YlxM (UPF0122 family)